MYQSIKDSLMTKLEFLNKLEEYQNRRNQKKWFPLFFGAVFWAFAVFPSIPMYLDETMFGLNSTTFGLLGTLCFLKAWSYSDITEEHLLLIDALELMKTSNNDT
jgi:hypothetical protein